MGGELATSVHMPAPAGEQGRERWPPRETLLGPKVHLLGENKSGEWDQPAAGWE